MVFNLKKNSLSLSIEIIKSEKNLSKFVHNLKNCKKRGTLPRSPRPEEIFMDALATHNQSVAAQIK